MEQFTFEEIKEHTFDSYCKRILKNESSDYHRRMNVLRQYEIPFAMLPQETLAQFYRTFLCMLLPYAATDFFDNSPDFLNFLISIIPSRCS